MIDFEYPEFIYEYNLSDEEKSALQIQDRPLISEWCEKNIELVSGGYVYPGPIKFHPWQIEPVNAPLFYDKVLYLGPTQTGKSTLADMVMFYCQSVVKVNGMVAYANKETVETVFKDRIRMMIEKNRCLNSLWNGDENMLTVQRLRLRGSIWRVASAQNKNDIASFPAGVCIGSEVGKWEKAKYNPVWLLKGRQGAYHAKGFQKLLLETTPFDVNDYMYQEVFNNGTIIVSPHYPCPHCGTYQQYTDYQIKLRNENDKYSDIVRRKKTDAVYYECVNCKSEITEADRARIDDLVVWAAPRIEQDDFTQEPEIINRDGSINGVDVNGKRDGCDAICYNWPRMVDINYQYWKCLADFFETKSTPEKRKTYENEVMARYYVPKSEKFSISLIESKKCGYRQHGEKIPNDVLIITLGVDTQDNGFYYVFVGWCKGMVWKILRHGFIYCPIQEYKDKQLMYAKFKSDLYAEPMLWPDGTAADYKKGFIDRGGHRAEDIDYICERMHNLDPCIGLTKPDDKKPLVWESDKADYYWVQTETLSDLTGTMINSDDFFIPDDVGGEFLRGIVRQYRISKKNINEIIKSIWVHGGDDHYRDCLNYAYAAGKWLNLDKILINDVACDTLFSNRASITQTKHVQQQTTSTNSNGRNSGYFARAYGRYR